MNKTMYYIIFAAFVLYLALKTRFWNPETGTPANPYKGFTFLNEWFPVEISRNVEKIFRLETRHFRSEQFNETASAGMVAQKMSFPFGWSTLKEYVDSPVSIEKDIRRYYTHSMNVNGKKFVYIGFPTLADSFLFLGFFLNKYGNNAGRWYSTNEAQQAEYLKLLQGIKTPFTNKLYNIN